MVRFLSCNVRGLGDYLKRKKLFHYFHIEDLDVVCLQETHSTKNVAKNWRTQWGGPIFYSHGTSASRGVAILFSKKLNVKIINSDHDNEGRIVKVRFQYEDIQLVICNIYAPNSDDPNFFINLFESLTPYNKSNLIIVGDFNLVLNLNLDKQGRPNTHKNAQKVFHSFIEELDLIDPWRFFNPNDTVFTWERGNVKVRLDFFLISHSLLQFVNTATIIDSYEITDHKYPFLDIQLTANSRGKGVWKLNTSLLQDKELKQNIENIIDEQILTEYKNHTHRWEIIKLLVRTECLRFSIAKNKTRLDKLHNIEQQLFDLSNSAMLPLSQTQLALRASLIQQ